MPGGPTATNQKERRQRALAIATRFKEHYGDQVLAIGLYGSLAKDSDGPFSDIEMHCVLKGEGIEHQYFEWSAGPWKAEVDIYSADVILAEAALLEGDWPITHSAFTEIRAIYDPQDFLPRLKIAALEHSQAEYQQVMEEVIVGEIIELVGKIRNAQALKETGSLSRYMVHLATWGACLIGLDQRHLYQRSARLFEDSLSLPGRPGGYDALCRLVMEGKLTPTDQLFQTAETFWSGLETWATMRVLVIEQDLEELLGVPKH